jgi:hypothetical protein
VFILGCRVHCPDIYKVSTNDLTIPEINCESVGQDTTSGHLDCNWQRVVLQDPIAGNLF